MCSPSSGRRLRPTVNLYLASPTSTAQRGTRFAVFARRFDRIGRAGLASASFADGRRPRQMVTNFKRPLIVGAPAIFATASFVLAHSSRTSARALPVGPGTPLVGHAGPVSSVAFSPNGRTLGTATENGTVQLWDLQRDRLARRSGGSSASSTALRLAPRRAYRRRWKQRRRGSLLGRAKSQAARCSANGERRLDP